MATYPYPTINDLTFVAYSGARIVFGGLYVTGQPSAQAYPVMAQQASIRSVICLRSPTETTSVPPPTPPAPVFDTQEQQILNSLGVSYTNAFVIERTMSQQSFNLVATQAALALIENQSGGRPALIHCSTGDRASSVFGVLLLLVYRVSNAEIVDYCTNCLLLANPFMVSLLQNYAIPNELSAAAARANGTELYRR